MKDQLTEIYKKYINGRFANGNNDLLYWIQVFIKSALGLIDILSERSGKIKQNIRVFVYKMMQKLIELCLLEVLM